VRAGRGILSWQIPQFTTWVSSVDSRLRDIACYDASRADDDVITYGYWQNCGVASDRHPITDPGAFPLRFVTSGRSAGSKKIVDEHHTVTDETIVADIDELADKTV
jgi:hypothetical protein